MFALISNIAALLLALFTLLTEDHSRSIWMIALFVIGYGGLINFRFDELEKKIEQISKD